MRKHRIAATYIRPSIMLLLPALTLSLMAHARAEPWKRHTVDGSDRSLGKLGADGVRLADANGDGYLDVVTGWEEGGAIRVCIHPGPKMCKQPWPAVTVGRVASPEDAVFADLDRDGALDVVTCCEGKTKTVFVHWAPKDVSEYLNADSWSTAAFPETASKQLWMYALPFDVNRDGHLDIVVGSKGRGGSVSWLRHPANNPRQLEGWKLAKIADAGWIMSIIASDLDGDGTTDVVYSDRRGERRGVSFLRHLHEPPWFAEPRLLGAGGEEVMFIDVADVNQDRRMDIAAAIQPDELAYLVQPEHFHLPWKRENQIQSSDRSRFGSPKHVRVADLNADAHLEAVVTCERASGGRLGVYSLPHRVSGQVPAVHATDMGGSDGIKFDRIELIDLDDDGDLDVLTCEERDNLGVIWYENPAR